MKKTFKKLAGMLGGVLGMGILIAPINVQASGNTFTENDLDVRVESVNEELGTVELYVSNKKTRSQNYISYDALNEILTIDDKTKIKFETTVTYVNPEVNKTPEEILLEHKMEPVKRIKEFVDGKNRSCDVGKFVPSNAPYIEYASFNKKISELYGDLGITCAEISGITGILFLLPKVPGKKITGAISTVTGVASYLIDKTKGYVAGNWSYTQHRTANQYNIGYIRDYAYRYGHKSLSLGVKINSKSYTVPVYDTTRGTWWTTRNPF